MNNATQAVLTKMVSLALAAVLLASGASAKPSTLRPATPGEPQLDLPRVSLQAGMHRIDAQVAQTGQQTQTGLMWRREMPRNEGMLFMFEQKGVQCFWMRNTLIALSIAYLDDDGTIANILEMQPLDETSRNCSTRPVRRALEMNSGWFAKRGLVAGDKITGAPFSKPSAKKQAR